MPTVKVLNMAGQEVSELNLNADIFGIEPNQVVMHAAVVGLQRVRRDNSN